MGWQMRRYRSRLCRTREEFPDEAVPGILWRMRPEYCEDKVEETIGMKGLSLVPPVHPLYEPLNLARKSRPSLTHSTCTRHETLWRSIKSFIMYTRPIVLFIHGDRMLKRGQLQPNGQPLITVTMIYSLKMTSTAP